MGHGLFMKAKRPVSFLRGTDKDCVRMSRGEMLWQIMAGAEI